VKIRIGFGFGFGLWTELVSGMANDFFLFVEFIAGASDLVGKAVRKTLHLYAYFLHFSLLG
jgi:hypothetical protein